MMDLSNQKSAGGQAVIGTARDGNKYSHKIVTLGGLWL